MFPPMSSHSMWAPWRMEYIRSPKEGGCIFCTYPAAGAASHRQNLILCAQADTFIILNRYPFAAGHLMVVPRRHVADLDGLGTKEYDAMWALVRDAARALRASCNADGVNVGINLGASAGAGIAEHMHVHLVPRWRGDLNFMPVVADVHVMPEALDATYVRLLPFFAPLSSRDASTTPGDGPTPARRARRRPRGGTR